MAQTTDNHCLGRIVSLQCVVVVKRVVVVDGGGHVVMPNDGPNDARCVVLAHFRRCHPSCHVFCRFQHIYHNITLVSIKK